MTTASPSQKADTTVVLTSCQRHDLLERTLNSFRTFNTDDRVGRIVVIEDGDGDPSAICRTFGAELIRTGTRIGQIAAIDRAYAEVDTPYIFHLEDDWEFYRTGFIERSRRILETDPSTLIVCLRAWDDTSGHPLSFRADDETFGVMMTNFRNVWHGFTFNPGLRRLADYKRIGSFSNQPVTVRVPHRKPTKGLQMKLEASQFYFKLGFRSVILDKTGFVKHIGWERHVSHPEDAAADPTRPAAPQPAPSPSIGGAVSRNALCPCGSGKRYKHCHGQWAS